MIPPTPPGLLCTASLDSLQQIAEHLQTLAKTRDRLLVGIGGPGGCGKSTLSHWLRHSLDHSRVLSLDDFRLPRDSRPLHARYSSHPEGNDLTRLRSVLADFRAGNPIVQPVFDREKGRALHEIQHPAPRILLADGEIAAHRDLRSEWDILILVEAPWQTQLHTRLTRDLRERNCSLKKVLDIFLQSNLRDYPRFAKGAHSDAHFRLCRNTQQGFRLRKFIG